MQAAANRSPFIHLTEKKRNKRKNKTTQSKPKTSRLVAPRSISRSAFPAPWSCSVVGPFSPCPVFQLQPALCLVPPRQVGARGGHPAAASSVPPAPPAPGRTPRSPLPPAARALIRIISAGYRGAAAAPTARGAPSRAVPPPPRTPAPPRPLPHFSAATTRASLARRHARGGSVGAAPGGCGDLGWPWRGGAEDPLPRGGCVVWGDASSLGSGLSILRRSASIGSGPATSRAAPSAGGFCFFSSLFLLLLLSVPFAFAPALPPSSISSPSVTSSVASEPHGAVMEPDILLNKRFFSYGNPGRLPCAFLLPRLVL